MEQELRDLMADLENGVDRIKDMTHHLESKDLISLSRQLQSIIVYSAELSKIIDDCEILQRKTEAKKAVIQLVEAGFPFNNIEIDGFRFDIRDGRDGKEVVFREDRLWNKSC